MSDIDINDAIIELTLLTKLTQPNCYCTQCSVLEKLNPPMKSDLACGSAESKILNPRELTRKELPICDLLSFTYLAYYASIEGT